jgi:hypothetical protein
MYDLIKKIDTLMESAQPAAAKTPTRIQEILTVLEEKMTPAQLKKREEIVMSMKSGAEDMKKRYGDRWQDVMYATATKQAMAEDFRDYMNTKPAEWRATSLSYEQACKKYGKENCKIEGKNRLGDPFVLVRPKEGEPKQAMAEGRMKDLMHADAEEMDLEQFLNKWAPGSDDVNWVTDFWKGINVYNDDDDTEYSMRQGELGNPDRMQEGVAEGLFDIDSKIKGKIQNIVSDLSDIPGMWDHKAQTFTDAGMDKLKAVLKNNPKYIKYALNLDYRDYAAEGVAEAAKPDFLDVDKDGDKKEPMKKAVADKKKDITPKKGVNPFTKKKTVKEGLGRELGNTPRDNLIKRLSPTVMDQDTLMKSVAKVVNNPEFTIDTLLKIVDAGSNIKHPAGKFLQKEFDELQYDLGRKYEDMPEEVADQLIVQLRQRTKDITGSRN